MVLHLYTDMHKPDFEYVLSMLNGIGSVKGIPISKDKMIYLKESTTERRKYLTKQLIEIFEAQLDIIDLLDIEFNAQLQSKNHIVYLLCNYYNLDIKKYEGKHSKTKNPTYTMTKPVMEIIRGMLERQKRDTTVMDMVLEVKELFAIESGLKQFYEGLMQFNKSGGKIKDGIFYLHPEFQTVDTLRITTKGPNIQGKTQTVKELITAPDGYKIANMDIKGQEVHILLWGIMTNKDIQRYYVELGDPYYAILKYLKMNLTEQNRENAKVPVLGLMNGMGRKTLISDIGDPELVDLMIKTIEGDDGFKNKIITYVDDSINQPNKFRKGLFGSTKRIERYEEREGVHAVRNKLRNGFFQLTAAEITAMCIQSIYRDIYKFDKTLDKLRLLTPIYDEFVFMYKESEEKVALEIIERNMKPMIDNWSRFLGKLKTGQHYHP